VNADARVILKAALRKCAEKNGHRVRLFNNLNHHQNSAGMEPITKTESNYILLPRREEDYLQTRVLDQIEWHDRKGTINKKWFVRLKVSEILLSLCIPFLTGYITNSSNTLKVTVGILGIAVAAIAGIITLIKFQENWIEYRTVAESLKMEKFLYLSKAGPYKDEPEPFPLFVERFETLISTSTKKWIDYTAKKETDKTGEQ
jgi:hypothetical protein